MSSIYELDGRIPVAQALPLGLQHILAMFVANITPIIILSNAVALDQALSATLIQNCMVIAGIGTLIQLYPIWRIGSRLPIVMGISFTFLSLAIIIASTQGMGTLMGAVIVGGVIEGCLGLFPKVWTKLIPKVVAATVVEGKVEEYFVMRFWRKKPLGERCFSIELAPIPSRSMMTTFLYGLFKSLSAWGRVGFGGSMP